MHSLRRYNQIWYPSPSVDLLFSVWCSLDLWIYFKKSCPISWTLKGAINSSSFTITLEEVFAPKHALSRILCLPHVKHVRPCLWQQNTKCHRDELGSSVVLPNVVLKDASMQAWELIECNVILSASAGYWQQHPRSLFIPLSTRQHGRRHYHLITAHAFK